MPSNSTVEGVNNGSTEDRASISSITHLDQIARLKKLYELSMTLAGDPIEVFRHIARMIGELLNVRVVCLSEVRGSELYFLAVYADGQIFSDAGCCPLEITPCATVEQSKDFQVYDRVMERFPEATFLARHNAFSYCGFPALDNNGNVVAVTCLLDDKPHDFTSDDEEILRIFGQRIGMEIERHKNIETRKQSEQALRDSEERFRATFSQAAVGIAHVAPDGKFLRINQKFCDIVGYTQEELLRRTFQDITHPDDLDADLVFVRQVLAGEIPTYSMEKRYFRKDGSIAWVNLTVSLVRDEQGAPKYFISVTEDISERKLAEEQMRQLSSVVEQTADSVVITDRDGVVQYVNPAYEKITGYTREEALGKKASLLKSGMHDEPFYQRPWNTISRGEVFRERLTNRKKDGSLYYEEKTITPLKNEKGDITHFVSTGKDITGRVLAENENRRMQVFLNSVVENLPNMLFVKDAKDLRFVRFNKAAEDLLGFSRDEMLGKSDYDFFPREEADFFTTKDRDVLSKGVAHDIPEEPVHTKHNGVRLLHTQKIPILDEAGKPLYLLGISEDITERRRVEKALARSATEWTYSMDFIEDAMYLIDTDDRVVRANRAFYQLTGLSPDQTIGRDITSIMHPRGETEPCRVCQARHARRNCHIVMEPQDPDNPTGRPIEVIMRIIRDAADTPTGVLMVVRDLTPIRETERVLRESAASLANAQRIAHLGSWDWNIATNELRWSDEIYRIFGLTPQQFAATYEAFLESVHPDDRQAVEDAVNRALQEKQPYRMDHRVVRPDGTERIVHEQAEVTFDETGRAVRMVGTVQDVTEYRETQERLSYLAYFDPLTGLPNRQQLHDHLLWTMKEADSRERLVAVLFLDLDRFKNINDTLGHDVGDELLQEVAARLKASVRPGDIVSRLGGDEFTLILANVAHVDDVTRVAQKLLDQFLPPFRIAGRDLFISPSIGITLYPLNDNSPENLLKNADIAMYHAKQMGRNNFQFYAPELNMRAARRLELETGLRQALGRNELVLHYQPLVKMDTGKITGMEALLRWQHPEYGLIPPMEFIPLAEETGLIVPIGEWVLRTACAQIKAWHATGFPAMHVAVNLSSVQLQQKNFARVVKQVLSDTGLDPQYLDLELTESLLMQDMEAAEAILRELNDFGVLFSLDDFGTGYSSLSYLKRFPIDFLKIDRSFVRDITHDRFGAGIVRAIIAMAHTLNIKVIAEGVETAEHLRFLREQGCDISQGYYCSEPLDVETFTDLLRDWKRIRMGKCSIGQTTGKPRKNRKKIKSRRRP